MKIKLGQGWAPEAPNNESLDTFAVRELRTLLTRIFTENKIRSKNKLRQGRSQ
jgi:hypothetical protein